MSLFRIYTGQIQRLGEEYVELCDKISKLKVALVANSFSDAEYLKANKDQLAAMEDYAELLLRKINLIAQDEGRL